MALVKRQALYILHMYVCSVTQSCPTLVTPWTGAHQAPLSMAFSKQEYWSGLPFLSPRDLLDPRIEPGSPASPALAGGFFTTVPPEKLILLHGCSFILEAVSISLTASNLS